MTSTKFTPDNKTTRRTGICKFNNNLNETR